MFDTGAPVRYVACHGQSADDHRCSDGCQQQVHDLQHSTACPDRFLPQIAQNSQNNL